VLSFAPPRTLPNPRLRCASLAKAQRSTSNLFQFPVSNLPFFSPQSFNTTQHSHVHSSHSSSLNYTSHHLTKVENYGLPDGANGRERFVLLTSQEKATLMIFSTAFNHSQSQDAEAEYDRLRDLARQEAGKRAACFDKVRFPSLPRTSTTNQWDCSRIKHMREVTELPRSNCLTRGRRMQPRWTNTINKPATIFSGRIMRRAESQTIRLICTGSLWKRRRTF
jgi:hypothetical protein